jgi:hypothetical protein
MRTAASIVLPSLAAYLAIGLPIGLWLVTGGVRRLHAHAQSVTLGGRAVLLAAAVGLWPMLLLRALRGPKQAVDEPHAQPDRHDRLAHLLAWCVLAPLLAAVIVSAVASSTRHAVDPANAEQQP